jgi:hypothetical protein
MKKLLWLVLLSLLISSCGLLGGPSAGDIPPAPFYSEKGSSELISFEKVFIDGNGRARVRTTGRQVSANESYDEALLSESEKKVLMTHTQALASRSSRERFFRDRDGQRDDMRMR